MAGFGIQPAVDATLFAQYACSRHTLCLPLLLQLGSDITDAKPHAWEHMLCSGAKRCTPRRAGLKTARLSMNPALSLLVFLVEPTCQCKPGPDECARLSDLCAH